MKMHEEHPDAPLSPIYINLRMPPKGVLTEETIEKIGTALYEETLGLGISFDHVVGLPKAGEPLARAFVKASGRKISLLRLKKEETERGRRILPVIHGKYNISESVLVIDDLITKADTKIEGIRALRYNGLAVNDCLVLVDHEQGGSEELLRVNVKLHVVFTMSWLLDLYVFEGLIAPQKREEVIDYQRKVEEYMQKNL